MGSAARDSLQKPPARPQHIPRTTSDRPSINSRPRHHGTQNDNVQQQKRPVVHVRADAVEGVLTQAPQQGKEAAPPNKMNDLSDFLLGRVIGTGRCVCVYVYMVC